MLRFLLDENVPARVALAIERHNLSAELPLDAMRIGDAADLPHSVSDPEILLWAEREGRVLLTEDKRTMAVHLDAHLRAGHHAPGIFMIRPGTSIPLLMEFFILAAYASEPTEWQDRITFVP